MFDALSRGLNLYGMNHAIEPFTLWHTEMHSGVQKIDLQESCAGRHRACNTCREIIYDQNLFAPSASY